MLFKVFWVKELKIYLHKAKICQAYLTKENVIIWTQPSFHLNAIMLPTVSATKKHLQSLVQLKCWVLKVRIGSIAARVEVEALSKAMYSQASKAHNMK